MFDSGKKSRKQRYRPTIVIIGGFLGAGKTSLIVAAARLLHARGVRAAAILNDQGSELVDTSFVEAHDIPAGQVLGGCFCCRLSDLISAADALRAHMPEVIFAEAVGSCTDISATVLQPLKLEHAAQFRVAPYTVLVDPDRATLRPAPPLPPALVVGPLLEGLDAALTAKGFTIAHLKVMDQSEAGWVKASIVQNGAEPSVEGTLAASAAMEHEILLNSRAAGSPEDLRSTVVSQLTALPGKIQIQSLQCFSPSPPKPEKRVGHVVAASD